MNVEISSLLVSVFVSTGFATFSSLSLISTELAALFMPLLACAADFEFTRSQRFSVNTSNVSGIKELIITFQIPLLRVGIAPASFDWSDQSSSKLSKYSCNPPKENVAQ